MKNIQYVIPALCLALLTSPASAQKNLKQWGNLLKNSVEKSAPVSNPARLLPKPISFEESLALENRLVALTALSRTLRRNPYLPNEAPFADYAQTLTLIGENLPTPPAADASALQKRQYAAQVRQYISRRLQQEEQHLSRHMRPQDGFAKSLSAAHTNWAQLRHQRTLANAQNTRKWDVQKAAVQAKQERFSWGEQGWDEITFGPARMPKDLQDPLFSARNTMYKLAQKPPKNFIMAMDFITYAPLNPYQKQILWQHLAQLNDTVGYQFVYGYMLVNHKLPALKAPGLLPQAQSPSMQQYARDTQLVLIEKLKKGEKWTEAQTNAFFDLNVFLPENNRRDILAALTYLEPDAALYLLAHPGKNTITQQLRGEVQAARSQATINNGVLSKARLQTKTGVFNSHRRLVALTDYYELLNRRLAAITKRFVTRKYQLQQAQHQPLPADPVKRMEKLSYRLYCQLDMQHLQELSSQIDARIKQIQTELMGLYETSGFR